MRKDSWRHASAYFAVFPLATHDLIPGLIVAERRCHVSRFLPQKKYISLLINYKIYLLKISLILRWQFYINQSEIFTDSNHLVTQTPRQLRSKSYADTS